MENRKSDVLAKEAYLGKLRNDGFEASICASPADIVARKGGHTWYFEIKMTHRKDCYFGAATSTEWKQAFLDPEHFRFVVVIANDDDTEFSFIELSPSEFMEYSTIPPFKVYFNLPLGGGLPKPRKGSKATPMTRGNFERMLVAFEGLSKAS